MYPEDKMTSVSTRETEISRVVSKLREAAKDSEETAKAYYARLEGVVVGGLEDDREEAVKSEFGTKLGQELDNIYNRIYKAGKSLHELLQRIEL